MSAASNLAVQRPGFSQVQLDHSLLSPIQRLVEMQLKWKTSVRNSKLNCEQYHKNELDLNLKYHLLISE